MKSLIISAVVIATIILSACNGNNNQSKANNSDSASQQPTVNTNTEAKSANSTGAILVGYLNLKNSLAEDDGSGAAKSGQEILDALSEFDTSSLTSEQKKIFTGLVGDLKENSEHINENADKIDHQREHFEMLSKDIYDLAKSVGTDKKLYLDSCPMYDNGKATWISEIKEIKNPYLGKKMDTCGAIKETIN
jgi:peptidoglycan hydrolase CwlO-like protein